MQVSHSRVDTFKQCAYKFKLRYIDELETYFNCVADNPLVVGTALHTGIEQNVDTAISEYYSQYPIIDDLHVNEATKLEAVINKCRDVLPRGIYEQELNCPEFKGFIDLLVPISENEYDMYDFKYSNNVDRYLESGQLHEYKFYFEKLNVGKTIRKMYFVFAPKVQIRQKKTESITEFRKRLRKELESKEVQVVEVPYNIEKVKDFLRNAKECRSATKFDKSPSRLCSWCEWQAYCEKGDDLMILPKNEKRKINANVYKKIWLYGSPFSGKTYLSNQFPDVLMLNTDGNIKFVDAPFLPIKDVVTQEGRLTKRIYAWEVFKETIDELEKADNDYKTIVVDLLEDVYDACRIKVCKDNGWEHESDDSFKAYDIVRSEFLRTLKRLLNLDYNIVLISHEDMSKDVTKKTGDKITSIRPNLADKVANKVAGMVDIVARVINDEGRYTLSFKTSDVIFGGGRLRLEDKEIKSSYEELCKVYDRANKGKEVKPVVETKVVETAIAPPMVEEVPFEIDEDDKPIEIVDVPKPVETADVPPTRRRRRVE